MIDKQKFNALFQGIPDLITEVTDLFAEEQPKIIRLLEQNLADHDLPAIKKSAHKLKGSCGQLYDTDSERSAFNLVSLVGLKIVEIIDVMLKDSPEILNKVKQEFDDSALIHQVLFGSKTIKEFLSGYLGPLSDENALKLEALETKAVSDGIVEKVNELKTSSSALLNELIAMKKSASK